MPAALFAVIWDPKKGLLKIGFVDSGTTGGSEIPLPLI